MDTLAQRNLPYATSMKQMQLIANENLCDLVQYQSYLWIEFCDGSKLVYQCFQDKAYTE